MAAHSTDTIFARASGPGKAGVAVFRLSGDGAFVVAERLCGDLPPLREAGLRKICAFDGELIDLGLVIPFKGPNSFTGQDVVELHLHGSPAVEAALYETLGKAGARPAEAGEFTRRALVNGKLDLAEVEGLADLLDAETNLQRMQALGQLRGRLSKAAEDWRKRLLTIMAPLEADIDFPDEDDVPAAVAARAAPAIEGLIRELETHRGAAGRARAIRDGVSIAIIGAPNAGKSSLLNRLVGSDRAIVSDTPGATRDAIEVRLDLGGVLVTLVDTAGLRSHTDDAIEKEGMRRTRIKADEAIIRIQIIDPDDKIVTNAGSAGEGRTGSRETVAGGGSDLMRPGDFIVYNKSDLYPDAPTPGRAGMTVWRMSAKTGAGVEEFVAGLTAAVTAHAGADDGALLSRERHVLAVDRSIEALRAALSRLDHAPELAAEDVRLAARALGGITGAVDVEDVLGEIFSSFCIGK